MTYDPSLQNDITGIRDSVLADLVPAGLVPNEHSFRLAFPTYTGGNPDAGIPGTETVVYVEPPYNPSVELKDQFRYRNGQTQWVGDAEVTLTRAITKAQIFGAAWFEIDGERYSLSEGEFSEEYLDWVFVAQRLKQ